MSDLHSAVGSYVTDALEPDEREEFQQHLDVCANCRQEVLELGETLAELTTMTTAPPPAALRASVLAAIHEVRPLPPEAPVLTAATTPEPPVVEIPREPHPSVIPDLPDELAERRRRRGLPRFVAVLAAAALVLALALGGWVVQLRQQQGEFATQQAAQAADDQREANLLAAPDARVVTTTVKGARVSYVVSKQRNEALFIGQAMAEPGSGKAYQLWTVKGSAATPAGLIPRGGNVRQWLTGPVDEADVLAVTVEPASGSTSPTLPILAPAKLTT